MTRRSGIETLLENLGFKRKLGVITLSKIVPDLKRDYIIREWAREASRRVCNALDFDKMIPEGREEEFEDKIFWSIIDELPEDH